MKSFVSSPDLLLARRAAAGQEEAWQEIVDLYGRRIFNLAYQFGGRPQVAEDLTQEIFLRLWRNLRSYRGDVPFAGWALRLSRNLCIDHYRRNRRRGTEVPAEVLDQLPAPDNPQRTAQCREDLDRIYRCVTEMPEDLATVLTLRDLQEWSGDETATFLGVAVGTVKSRLHRARKLLRKRLAEDLDTGAALGRQEA